MINAKARQILFYDLKIGETRELILECVKCREPMYVKISNVLPPNGLEKGKAFSDVTFPTNYVGPRFSAEGIEGEYLTGELKNREFLSRNPVLWLGILALFGIVFVLVMQWIKSPN